MKYVGLIPVRLKSTRLPSKALKNICGMPAIVHVFKRCEFSKYLNDLYVVTDSKKIKKIVENYNGKVILTKKHKNGSERIFEASKMLKFQNVINIQGDEILIDPTNIDKLILQMKKNKKDEYFIGVTKFNLQNQKSVFKAVLDNNKNLIYCSREDIPSSKIITDNNRFKVVFTVGYRKQSLKNFVKWRQTYNEKREPNEFLRILDNEKKIKTVYFKNAHISLDTITDLKKIRKIMVSDKLFKKYKI